MRLLSYLAIALLFFLLGYEFKPERNAHELAPSQRTPSSTSPLDRGGTMRTAPKAAATPTRGGTSSPQPRTSPTATPSPASTSTPMPTASPTPTSSPGLSDLDPEQSSHAKLDSLRRQIEEQRRVISQLQSQAQTERTQTYQSKIEEAREFQTQRIEKSAQVSAISKEKQKTLNLAENLSQQIKDQTAKNINNADLDQMRSDFLLTRNQLQKLEQEEKAARLDLAMLEEQRNLAQVNDIAARGGEQQPSQTKIEIEQKRYEQLEQEYSKLEKEFSNTLDSKKKE